MANQGLNEIRHLIEHWDDRTREERLNLAERVVALSMLSGRDQVRLQAARIIIETYSRPHGLPGSAGEDDSFGEDDAAYGTGGFSKASRQAI